MLYHLPTFSKKCYYEKRHINATRGFCHGNILKRDKTTFIAHLFVGLKDFVLDNLQLGLSIPQVMAKHHRNVHELVKTSGNLTICEQNIVGKLAKEVYKKHENNAKYVCMWAQENPNVLFYCLESGFEVGGELSS
jgi:hypothetical protein